MKHVRIGILAVAFFSVFASCEGGHDDDDDDDDDDDAVSADELCIEAQTCAGEEDPAGLCRQSKENCLDDETCVTLLQECAVEIDAQTNCLADHGTCDELEDGGAAFGVDAVAEGGRCEGVSTDVSDCVQDVLDEEDDEDDGE